MHRDNGVYISSKANWTKSQSNCKDPSSKENHATDVCEQNKYTTTETGMWTNIFRVEMLSHVDHGNIFCNNKRIYLFILQSLHLLYKYAMRKLFVLYSSSIRIPFWASSIREILFYVFCSPVREVQYASAQNQCGKELIRMQNRTISM